MQKVSVIVPVYNAQSVIVDCFMRLLNQTLNDIEIIAVDDASTDGSLILLNKFEEKYPGKLIVVALKKHMGVGKSRSIGLDHATGDYVAFVNSGDEADITMFEKMHKKACEKRYDIVDCGVYIAEKEQAVIYTTDELTGALNLRKRGELIAEGGYLCSKIFRRDFIRRYSLEFSESIIADDLGFLIGAYINAENIGNVKEVLYLYKGREQFSSGGMEVSSYYIQVIEMIRLIYNKLLSAGKIKELFDAAEYCIMRLYSAGINALLFQKSDLKRKELLLKLGELREIIKKMNMGNYENPYIIKKMKIADINTMKLNDREPEELLNRYLGHIDFTDAAKRYTKDKLIDAVANIRKANEYLQCEENICSEDIVPILIQCQDIAISLGNYLEKKGAEGEKLVRVLERYCEDIYMQSTISDDKYQLRKLSQKIEEELLEVENGIQYRIPEDKREIVFFPYKASMWDSLESIWVAATDDRSCNVEVVPIPYFDKNEDGSFGEMHYEGDEFPDYVPVVSWENYNMEDKRPDIVFIHNPYDDLNRVTSVHPNFYIEHIKEYADKLIYVPYFLLPNKFDARFATVNGVLFSDRVFVQNDEVRQGYINTVKNVTISSKYADIEERIIAIGTPKTDKVVQCGRKGIELPDEWKKHIRNRKVIFLNTNVSLILNNSYMFIENMRRIFDIFDKHSNEYAVIWREHPLSVSTIKAMRSQLLEPYLKLKKEFAGYEWAILDDNPEAYTAMAVSDCYFGAGGSLIALYAVTGKPMMVTAYKYPEGISDKNITVEELLNSSGNRMYYNEKNVNALGVFLDNLERFQELRDRRIELASQCTYNIDGTVGKKIYDYIKNEYLC